MNNQENKMHHGISPKKLSHRFFMILVLITLFRIFSCRCIFLLL